MKTINKTKNIVLLAGICAAVLLAAGCNDDKNVLANTKWKLVGIVNTETGEIKELEPKDCEECYTLTFTTGTKAEVLVYREKISIDLSYLGQIERADIPFATEEDRYFIEALLNYNTKSYTVTSIELKFINDVENYYLLFKSQKP